MVPCLGFAQLDITGGKDYDLSSFEVVDKSPYEALWELNLKMKAAHGSMAPIYITGNVACNGQEVRLHEVVSQHRKRISVRLGETTFRGVLREIMEKSMWHWNLGQGNKIIVCPWMRPDKDQEAFDRTGRDVQPEERPAERGGLDTGEMYLLYEDGTEHMIKDDSSCQTKPPERQKLDYVIKLMSEEKIRRGTTLAEIKRIFGKDLKKIDAKTPDGERQYGVSFREKPSGKTLSSKENGSAQARQAKDISWGVTFYVDAGDRVSFYYLTNFTSK